MIGLRTLRMLQEDEGRWAVVSLCGLTTGSPWVWPSISSSSPTFTQTSVPQPVLNEPGIADKNISISASSVKLSISHRIESPVHLGPCVPLSLPSQAASVFGPSPCSQVLFLHWVRDT